MKIRAGIIGVTGYTGGELLRLLVNHPDVEIKKVSSRSNAGNEITRVHNHLYKKIDLIEERIVIDSFCKDLDVVFLALPHGKSAPLVKEIVNKKIKVIDLGADFRLKELLEYEKWYETEHACPELLNDSVYGLPEIYKEEIRNTMITANPGCYPTSILLGLAPLIKNKIINMSSIIADSKSGITGAGKTLSQQSHYPDMNENFLAYKVGGHRHISEIEQELSFLGNTDIKISFTPHLVPMNRGILSTVYADSKKEISNDDLQELYLDFYKECPFIRIRELPLLPQTKWVQGSNYCDIAPLYEARTGRIIVISAIDNLVKGASGQAIQNMNIMFGLDEKAGLLYAPLYP